MIFITRLGGCSTSSGFSWWLQELGSQQGAIATLMAVDRINGWVDGERWVHLVCWRLDGDKVMIRAKEWRKRKGMKWMNMMMMLLPNKIAYNVICSFIIIYFFWTYICANIWRKKKQICSGCACWHLQKLFLTLTLDLAANLKHGGNDSTPF